MFALITWSLASSVFPAQNPGLSDTTYVSMALVAALLFFASLLLHELGHAIQARRDGVEIEGITLWLFGGVATFRSELPTAGAEFRIAIAGPLVTLVLGGACVAIAALTHMTESIDGIAAWLGYINLFLLAFNMLPALPLDGGRVLRAILWGGKHDFVRATILAARISRLLAYVMIGGGLVLLVAEGTFSGAWLAFLGWFLLSAASGETRHLAVQQALSGLTVRQLMVTDPVTADPDETLGEFMDGVAGVARFTAYPVVTDGVVLGMLPLRRVLETPRSEWDDHLVRDRMISRAEVPVLSGDEEAVDALTELSAGELHRGLVLDASGRLAGLVSITDLLRLLTAAEAARRAGRRGR